MFKILVNIITQYLMVQEPVLFLASLPCRTGKDAVSTNCRGTVKTSPHLHVERISFLVKQGFLHQMETSIFKLRISFLPTRKCGENFIPGEARFPSLSQTSLCFPVPQRGDHGVVGGVKTRWKPQSKIE